MKLKKTPLPAKLLILAVCIFALISLVGLQGQIREKQAQVERLQEELMYEEQENKELQEDMAALGSNESIIKIARERLGMVADGEVVFYDTDSN